jgi:hypothetical protein
VLFVNTKEEPFNTPAIPDPPLYSEATWPGSTPTPSPPSAATTCSTPDDVRGDAATLRQAVITKGWPTQASSRGKVLLVLDSNPRVAQAYRSGTPAPPCSTRCASTCS